MTHLIKLVVEHILIVRKCNDELDDQFSSPSDDGTAGPPVGVLPADAIVLLMDTDNVRSEFTTSVWPSDDAVEIFDHSETITAQLQVVRAVPEATVAEVEGLFTMERRTGISVGHGLSTMLAGIMSSDKGGPTISLKDSLYRILRLS